MCELATKCWNCANGKKRNTGPSRLDDEKPHQVSLLDDMPLCRAVIYTPHFLRSIFAKNSLIFLTECVSGYFPGTSILNIRNIVATKCDQVSRKYDTAAADRVKMREMQRLGWM